MKKIFLFTFLILILSVVSCNVSQEITFTGIEDVNIISIGKNGIEAEIKAKIKNPNHLSFVVYKSDMNIAVNGTEVGVAELKDKVKIKRNSEDVYTFKVQSDFSKLSMLDLPKILAATMSKQLTVGVKGELKVGKALIKRSIPVSIVEKIKL
jgi:LEA14-like dessication related protein